MNDARPTYPKIETLFDRGPDFTVDPTRLRRAEFGLIDKWLITEKIDGTNVRLRFERADWANRCQVLGKSDNASLHPGLLNVLTETLVRIEPQVIELMSEHGLQAYTLFGEGYGPKIQSGGRYRTVTNDQGFVLFDINANDSAWLDESQITATAELLQLERVPYVQHDPLTREEIVELVRGGFASGHAQVSDYTFQAEGVVARTSVPLYDRRVVGSTPGGCRSSPGDRGDWKLIAGEYNRDPETGLGGLRLDVAGFIIVDSLTASTGHDVEFH